MDPFNPKITLIDMDEAAAVDVVVCITYRADKGLMLPDNVLDRCAHCSKQIQLRPNVPPQPMRLCLKCAVDFMGKGATQ